eukprot:14650280-Alexandrium_andersonii.AAC.1
MQLQAFSGAPVKCFQPAAESAHKRLNTPPRAACIPRDLSSCRFRQFWAGPSGPEPWATSVG